LINIVPDHLYPWASFFLFFNISFDCYFNSPWFDIKLSGFWSAWLNYLSQPKKKKEKKMMGYGSYGHGGFSSSSSNLSALAPPFTVSPKPNSSPLVDLTEPSYGVPLSSSLHNWLPSHYPNSGPGYFSNHNSEFNPMPSSNAFSYPGLQDIESPNTHLPPVNPSASASADAFLRGQCLDGVAASLVEDKRYHPTYAPPAIQDHDPLVAPDKTSYGCFSSSRAATLDGSSNNDYIRPGSGYTADWGESWNRLGDWEHGKQVELEGSFCSKDIYKNYMNQGISTLPYNIDPCFIIFG